ncbi:MAG: fibronectin type III domain-containing protein, partial [Candidatus Omnitrophica bacterium]|nr:fibronectin type III domain-containing protein [Candidatus Omnitrophota bacterium]
SELAGKYGYMGAGSAELLYTGNRAMIFYNPYASKADWRPVFSKGLYAEGMGMQYFHDGWNADAAFFGAHASNPTGVDHDNNYANNFQIYRKNDWALTHVIGYGTVPALRNTHLVAGFSAMGEAHGSIAHEAGPAGKYVLIAGASGGSAIYDDYYDPPTTFCSEMNRRHFYLSSKDNRSATVILHDRINAVDPGKLDRYYPEDLGLIQGAPGLKQLMFFSTAAPSVTTDAVSWKTPVQNVRIQTGKPAEVNFTTGDASSVGGGSVHPEEYTGKYFIRIMPKTKQVWDTFVNVVQAYDDGARLMNTFVKSSSGEPAEGVLIQREGEEDALALFNAKPGLDIAGAAPNLQNGRLAYDPALLDKIKNAAWLKKGYSVTFASATATTEIYLVDLDPAVAWSIKVDGNATAPLTVSNQGLGRATVNGAGAHTLSLLETGQPVDAAPPVISDVAGTSATTTGAVLTWTTDETATSQVEYGLTTAYGSSTSLDSALITNHRVTLSGLAAGTTYHYRVHSKDAAGNLATSGDFTVRTQDPPDTTAPAAPTGLTATAGDSQVILRWSANTEPDFIRYDLSRAATQSGPYTLVVSGNQTSATDTGLANGTTYWYRVTAVDKTGNESVPATVSATPLASSTGNGSLAEQLQINGCHFVGHDGGDNATLAQSFRLGGSGTQKVQTIALHVKTTYLNAWGIGSDPTGGLLVQLRTDAGGQPSKTALASALLNPPIRGAWNSVTLAAPIEVTAGTLYWIVIEYAGPVRWCGSYGIGATSNDGYPAGTAMRKYPSGPWHLIPGDLAFKVNGAGGGIPSATPPDTTPPAAPAGLTATAGDGRVTLSWSANTESDLAGYNIYQAPGAAGPFLKLTANFQTTTAYSATGLTNGTSYYFHVRAVDANANESSPSAAVSATPVAAAPAPAPALQQYDTLLWLGHDGGDNATLAQSFRLGGSGPRSVTRLEFFLTDKTYLSAWGVGSDPAGGILVELRTDAGGRPSENILASGTVGALQVGNWNAVSVTPSMAVTAGTSYWLVLKYMGPVRWGASYGIGATPNDGYPAGTAMRKYPTGPWHTIDHDLAFSVSAS